MTADPELDQLVAAIHAAVLQPASWTTVIGRIAQTMGAHGACLFTPEPTATPIVHAHGSTAASVDDYLRTWAPHDAWIAAARERKVFQHAGELGHGCDVLPVERLRRTAFHADFLRHYDIEGLLSLKVADGRDPVCPTLHLSFYLPPSQESFSPSQAARLRLLWPHLHGALQAHVLLERGRLFEQAATDVLDALPEPALVLRADRHIDFANAAARELLSRQPWMQVAQGRLVRVADLDDDVLASRCAGAGGGRQLVARLPETGQPLVLHVVPLRESPTFALRWPHAQVLLLLRLPTTPQVRAGWRARLAQHYQFTRAELRVLEQLLDGHDMRAIADLHQVSLATVRTQLRALLAKTGCSRQVDLVLLASSV